MEPSSTKFKLHYFIIPKEDLHCPICKNFLINPMQCKDCEEIFCHLCISNQKSLYNSCINCSSSSLEIIPAPMKWLKLYSKTQLLCINDQCGEVLCIENAQSHGENCLYRKIICEKCQEIIIFIDQENHKDNLCKGRLMKCPHEGCDVFIEKEELEEHYLQCEFIPLCDHEDCLKCQIERKKGKKPIGQDKAKENHEFEKNLIEKMENKKDKLKVIVTEKEELYECLKDELELKSQNNQKIDSCHDLMKNHQKEIEGLNLTLSKREENIEFLINDFESFKKLEQHQPELAVFPSNLNEENSEKKPKLEQNLFENPKDLQKEPKIEPGFTNTSIQILKDLLKEPKFEPDFSKDYYVFSENFTKATWAKSSNVPFIADYPHYPVARINYLFKSKFSVKFSLNNYGWFGVGSEKVSSNGFPGYVEGGFMISTDNGRLFNNNKKIQNGGFLPLNNKEINLICDPEKNYLEIVVEKRSCVYKGLDLPKEIYFMVAVKEGTSAKLIALEVLE